MSYSGRGKFMYGERGDAKRAANPKKRNWNPNYKKPDPSLRGKAYKAIALPSVQQVAIFNHFAQTRPLVVVARAGTGKTATVVHGMTECIPKGKSICYMIFANRNAREAESKCHNGIVVTTTHSFGLKILKNVDKNIEVDVHGEKSRNIAQALLGPEDEKLALRYNFCKAMDLAKGALCEDVEHVIEVCDNHEVEFDGMDPPEFAAKVLEGLELSAKQWKRVEFSDMLWLPWKLNLNVPTFDYVIADECQDLNANRRWLVLRACGFVPVIGDGPWERVGNCKLVAIGDDKQAIFGFTGADSTSIQQIIDATGADTLPLTTTYRCGKAIVALAQSYVEDYQAAPTNGEGEVAERTYNDMEKPYESGGAGAGDFILSRVNAPLVKRCLQFVKEGRRAKVLGKELGKNLSYMVKKSNAQSVGGFLAWLDEWQRIECERLTERNKPCDHITDKADCLRALSEGAIDLSDVRARIEDMFESEDKVGEGPSRIILSTVHKSKGLETDRAWILNDTFKCQGPEEDNVYYVAITRAKDHLYMVSK